MTDHWPPYQVKPICVPLLKHIRLTPENYPQVVSSLKDLLVVLRGIENPRQALQDPLIKYIFFPISEILRLNNASSIPDHIMECILHIIAILLKSWWWYIDIAMWKGLLVFCSSSLPNGDPEAKGKTKARDEETQAAALECLWELLRNHGSDKDVSLLEQEIARKRVKGYASLNPPLIASILTSVLLLTASPNRSLQVLSLQVTQVLVEAYFGESYAPNILPGVISKLSKLVMRREGRTHQQGDIVKLALQVMQSTIILTIGDDVCIREGAVRVYNSLDDFNSLNQPSTSNSPKGDPGMTVKRSPTWLSATASQLHNALNAFIPPLTEHPTPSALEGLIAFCQEILLFTSETLPQSQALLLIPLLALTLHSLPLIADAARQSLLHIFSLPSTKSPLLNTFIKLAQDNLSSLPRLLVASQDYRLTRCIKILIAIASLSTHGLHAVSKSVSHILGPSGGIEKWGWGILEGLELALPNAFFLAPNADTLFLQGSDKGESTFPNPAMRYIADLETQIALVQFFRIWGEAAGDEALFAVEWFIGYASKGSGKTEVSALWCSARLLEGIAKAPLNLGGETSPDSSIKGRSIRLKRHARRLTKLISSFWERDLYEDVSQPNQTEESNQLIEYVKGTQSLEKLLDMGKNAKANNMETNKEAQRTLYLSHALQLLSIASSILEASFSALLIHALYPVLHSSVSPHAFLSSTAHSALLHISLSCGFATPSNLLLSNFDYALNSVSRHLTRQRLDLAAPKVLVILVRLVGKGVVDRAGDVVEECFERLDDYHGYSAVVEGLVEVLGEVVKAVEREGPPPKEDSEQLELQKERRKKPRNDMEEFITWYRDQNKPQVTENEDFGPHPRHAWGDKTLDEIKNEEESRQKPQDDEPKLSPTQKLIQQIVLKSIHFLTHPSAFIRSRILSLLASSISTLSSIESSILPAVHTAWPFILNRLKDNEVFVVVEAAQLVSALVENVGDFVDTKIWEDIWPLFASLIAKLEKADKQNALSKRLPNGQYALGTQSIYTSSYRLYSAILKTITKSIVDVGLKDKVVWDVLSTCRRFLAEGINEELQNSGRSLYLAMAAKNADAVWLVLGGAGDQGPEFLNLPQIRANAEMIFEMMD